MKNKTYTKVAQLMSSVINKNNQADKYRALIEKLMQLEPNDWPKCLAKFKKLHTQLKFVKQKCELKK